MEQNQPSRNFLHLWCGFLAFEVSTLLIGFAIWMIAHGIYLVASRLVLYWSPARVVLMKTLKIQNDKYLLTPPMTWWRLIVVLVHVVLGLAMVYFGARTLLANGFLNQNLIYLATR
ncbi:MAG: hypothetical protein AB1564_13320 [Chloroflexota bacterium]